MMDLYLVEYSSKLLFKESFLIVVASIKKRDEVGEIKTIKIIC